MIDLTDEELDDLAGICTTYLAQTRVGYREDVDRRRVLAQRLIGEAS